MMTDRHLLERYDVPVPRYTSYPTVPFWKEHTDPQPWMDCFLLQFGKVNRAEGISLYIHLPFCESLCTYCGCNKKITSNHSVEDPYMAAVVAEWRLYLQLMEEKPVIRELHLGGGTPTFFSPAHLTELLDNILKDAVLHPDFEFSFEGHPNNTSPEHLQALYQLGFRRVSFGVQDNDPVVQKVINRIQPFEHVVRVTEQARAAGYHSVNFDLIYGLPFQTPGSIRRTISQVLTLRPDRVAFYSYAHVPWTSRGQRLFDEHDLPPAHEKLRLYLEGKALFLDAGYTDIGMDHFALPGDELHRAWTERRLHRNFMGYTSRCSGMMLGLGVSAISDAGMAYAQNHKTLHDYYRAIEQGVPALHKGMFLSEEDIRFKKYILDISCHGKTSFDKNFDGPLKAFTFPVLEVLAGDGLVSWNESGLEVTGMGRSFIRNICSAFDLHLHRSRQASAGPMFSKSV